MPLLLLLKNLRLPTRGELEIAGCAALVFFFVAWQRRGEQIAARDAVIAAKPRVEFRDRIIEKRVTVRGPIQIVKVRTPDGTVTTTTNRSGETVTADKDRALERSETPVCPAHVAKTWGLGGALDLRRRDRGAAAVSKSFGDLTLSLGHAWGGDARLGDVNAGLSIKVW